MPRRHPPLPAQHVLGAWCSHFSEDGARGITARPHPTPPLPPQHVMGLVLTKELGLVDVSAGAAATRVGDLRLRDVPFIRGGRLG